VYDVFQMSQNSESFSAKDIGLSMLLSMSGGSAKLVRLINKKLCGKKGCKVPPVLDEKHIFHGEIKRPGGKPMGYHSTADPTSSSIVISRGLVSRKGIYEAVVGIRNPVSGNHKKKKSTMFPDYWSKSMVKASLYAAWNKGNGKKKSKQSVGGIKIQYYVEGIWLRGHPVK
jgi:hypothetical protein